MSHDRADFDNLAWDKNDEISENSQKVFRRVSIIPKLEAFVGQKFGKTATWLPPVSIGGYNNLYRLRLEGSNEEVMIRIPQPHISQFPDEKTLQEAATAKFLVQQTKLPVPQVFFYGPKTSEFELGPFIIMPYVESCQSMSRAMAMPNKEKPDDAHMLNPEISEDALEAFYEKAAVCLLQLVEHNFPRIGSLVETEDGVFSIGASPLTQNMNNAMQLANIPRTALPPNDKTYGTADEWYIALAEIHFAQLVFQHNDLVSSADDCRNKYIARKLFHKLAKDGCLSTFGFAEDNWSAQSEGRISLPAPSGSDSFKLWCDDFRPGNVLLTESDDVVAIVDFEFTYAAPTQFALDPPWWLLINVPEWWHTNMDDWTKIYDARLPTWLKAMKKVEQSTKSQVNGNFLSEYMRESWETGRFWLSYAVRKSWAFDTIFWKYLDQRFFGSRQDEVAKEELWKTRVHLLSEGEKQAMEAFVERKMEESKERVLVEWEHEDVKKRMAKVLCDSSCKMTCGWCMGSR